MVWEILISPRNNRLTAVGAKFTNVRKGAWMGRAGWELLRKQERWEQRQEL